MTVVAVNSRAAASVAQATNSLVAGMFAARDSGRQKLTPVRQNIRSDSKGSGSVSIALWLRTVIRGLSAPLSAGALVLAFCGSAYAGFDEVAGDQARKNNKVAPFSAELNLGDPSEILRTVSKHVWHEFGWLLVILILIAWIKKSLLKQSMSEIVACLLSCMAFVLLHAIELVRFAALELRQLAKDLRNLK